MVFDLDLIRKLYGALPAKVDAARKLVGKPLTLAEKILYSHLFETPTRAYERGKDYVDFAPDRVAMQDATAQMALLQFMTCGRDKVAVPSTVHCDHLIQAKTGATAEAQRTMAIWSARSFQRHVRSRVKMCSTPVATACQPSPTLQSASVCPHRGKHEHSLN